MRSFYSIRSIGIGLALIGASLLSLFVVTVPASAEAINPLDAGYHLKIQQKITVDFAYVVFDVLPVAEVDRLDDRAGALIAVAELYPLKPEYAESYASNGLNFLDLRRRCYPASTADLTLRLANRPASSPDRKGETNDDSGDYEQQTLCDPFGQSFRPRV